MPSLIALFWTGMLLQAATPSSSPAMRSAISQAASAPADSRTDVLLLKSEEPLAERGYDRGLLIRELLRQSVLIAGREGLGLATRDMALREPFPAALAEAHAPLRIETLVKRKAFVRMTLSATAPATAKPWTKEWAHDRDEMDYLWLITECERQSRTGLIDALKGFGFRGTPNKLVADAPLPENAEDSLAEMTMTAQFAALRQLHAAMRSSGESLPRLSGLVRAYANLGILTDFHWTGAHKVFKARALLYAERMAAADPNSALARHSRAYARALTGMHASALEDVAAGRQLSAQAVNEGGQPEPEPTWVKIVEAYCKWDLERLQAIAEVNRGEAQLPRLLSFLAIRNCGATTYIIQRGLSLLSDMPQCYSVYDWVTKEGGVSLGHQITLRAPETLAAMLPQSIGTLPDLPPAVRAELSGGGNGWLGRVFGRKQPSGSSVAALSRSLLTAGEPAGAGEPSWAMLGRLVQETVFVQAYQRAYFLRGTLGVDSTEYVEQVLPDLEEHPYREFIRSLQYTNVQHGEYIKCLKDLNLVDMGWAMYPLFRVTQTSNNLDIIQGEKAWWHLLAHDDRCFEDGYNEYNYITSEQVRTRLASELLAISPHSPLAMAALINWNWKEAEPKAAEWLKEHGSYPTLLGALGSTHYRLNQYQDAERCLKKYIELSPDQWGYEKLADTYWRAGSKEKWVETLEQFLQQPDYGLSHARIRVRIARSYMDEKQFDKALPYAEEAAQTWAAWAMTCAAECHEGLGEWGKAEQWLQRVSERYEGWATDWFIWCKRTGKGDVESAREVADQQLAKVGESARTENLLTKAVICLLEGDADRAAASLKLILTKDPEAGTALHLAIIHDAADKATERDAAIMLAVTRGATSKSMGPARPYLISLAALLQQAFASGKPENLDIEAVRGLIKAADEGEQTNLQYFAGRFLLQHGREADGLALMKDCAASKATYKLTHVLARDYLRRREAATQPASGPATRRSARGLQVTD
jgi:tetratricopeptide (TPR) repeat protein